MISYGEALIGNTGGIAGSRDISATGNCANILSRIDEISKNPIINDKLGSQSIILTEEASTLLLLLFPDIQHSKINLESLGILLRDFPEEKELTLFNVETINLKDIENNKVNKNVIDYLLSRYVLKTFNRKNINTSKASA